MNLAETKIGDREGNSAEELYVPAQVKLPVAMSLVDLTNERFVGNLVKVKIPAGGSDSIWTGTLEGVAEQNGQLTLVLDVAIIPYNQVRSMWLAD